MAKRITGVNVDKAIGRITRPSVFDRIVKEIDANEVPSKFVETVIVQYLDGSIVELTGKELTYPVPINRRASLESLEEAYKKMRDVKVFINVEKLEREVNILVEQYLGKHC